MIDKKCDFCAQPTSQLYRYVDGWMCNKCWEKVLKKETHANS